MLSRATLWARLRVQRRGLDPVVRQQVFLPVLLGPHNHLRFAPYFPHSTFSKNCFGIPELRVPRSSLLLGVAFELQRAPLRDIKNRTLRSPD